MQTLCFQIIFIFALLSAVCSTGLRVGLKSIKVADFPEVSVSFTVHERSGRALEQIQRKNIYLYEDGTKLENFYMEVSKDPVEVVLVIDDSGSMHGHKKLLARAVQGFIRLLDEIDKAMIISFSDTARILHPMSGDKTGLTKSLRKLRAYGATALYDAIYLAAGHVSGRHKSAIIVLSDGMDQNKDHTARQSAHDAVEAVSKAVHADVPIYTIGLGRKINRQELKDFARLSKGSFYYTPNASQLEDLYSLVARNLKSDVKIRYVTPRKKKDATFRNVQLEIRSGNLSGMAGASYFAPGKFTLETTGFGYIAGKGDANRDAEMKIKIIDENGLHKTGGKEFVGTWINHLGK